MAIFSLFKYNQSNGIDVRIGDETIKITTILTVWAMLAFKKKLIGRARNKSGGGEIKIAGQCPPCPLLATRLISGPDLHGAGPLALWGFLQDLPAKYRGRPKKILQFERGTPSWYYAILW